MKKVGFLKLTQLNKVELEERQMNALRGGDDCAQGCACGCGGSSTTYTNSWANHAYGYTKTYGWGDNNDSCACTGCTPAETTSVGQSTANSGSGY